MSPSPPGPPIPILIVEDNPTDAHLARALVEGEGGRFRAEVVTDLAAALRRLAAEELSAVLLDLTLPDAQGLLGLTRIREIRPDLPIVIFSGQADEEMAVEAVAAGAQDYLVKGRIDRDLLTRALRYAMERQRLMLELREALARVRTLSGLLPICSSCKNIRDDQGYWQAVEVYVQSHTEAAFSHALCPACARRLYPDLMGDWRPEETNPLREPGS